ncbi:MAG: hypothetical protein ACOCUI_02070 [bacterium]
MPSYKNYENNFNKYSHSDDLFKKPKSMIKDKKKDDKDKERIKLWTTFYRRNLHRFVEHYGQIKLHFFQKIWLYLLGISETFVAIASRGISKSWIVALYAICICILYPRSEVVIAAGSKKQAGMIISDKIRGFFQERSPNFAREIKRITASNNDWIVHFHNGSKIKVVPATDLARGNRATVNVYEEFRLIDKKILDTVLSPFLYSRQPPYLLKNEYKHLAEEPKEIYISSAYYKAEWWYDELRKIVKMHYKKEDANFIGFDYLLSIFHGLKTKKVIKKEREKLDEISFMMEYENIPFGENTNSYFKLNMFKKNQKIKKAFYPIRKDLYTNQRRKKEGSIPIKTDEKRIVSVDIATRTGKENDNTVITCFRLLPQSKGYKREIVYMESHQGENTILQTLRIKQIYNDFEADYIVLDLRQAGISIYEQLGLVTRDEERDIEYDAYTVVDEEYIKKYITEKTHEELKNKTLATNAIPIIFPITADAQWNNDIAVDLRDKLQKGMVSLLIDENGAEDYLLKKNKEYAKTDDVNLKAWYIHPYAQIREFINETVNLEYSIKSGKIKIEESKRGNKKDRYISVSYGNYFATLLERDLLKEKDNSNMQGYFVAPSSLPWNNNNRR